jgi:hypothetical protein
VFSFGAWISVELVQQPAVNTNVNFTVMRFESSSANCGAILSGVNLEVVSKGFSLVGTASLVSVPSPTSVGMCLLQVALLQTITTLPAVVTTNVLGDPFTVLLDQDCTTFNGASANAILSSAYNTSGITFTTNCASTLLTFVCSGATKAAANAHCQVIYSDITNPTSTLFVRLKTILTTTPNGGISSGGGSSTNNNSSSSNTSLYALTALAAIPVILLVILVIACISNKKPPPELEETTSEKPPVVLGIRANHSQYQYMPFTVSAYPAVTQTPYSTPAARYV